MSFYRGILPFLLALPVFAAQYELKIPGATIAAIASDRYGAVYVTGSTSNPNLPTTDLSLERNLKRGTCGYSSGVAIPCTDAFVAKVDADGTLAWVTYLGGAGNDRGTAIAVDPTSASVWVAGTTTSADFPSSFGAAQTENKGPFSTGLPDAQTAPTDGDAFVVRITATGQSLIRSTFLGGVRGDVPRRLVIDSGSNVYVTGSTQSADYPVTSGGMAQFVSSFVTKLDPTLSRLMFSIFVEAEVYGLAVAPDYSVYLTGWSKSMTPSLFVYQTETGAAGDAVAIRLRNDGTLAFATYLGGKSGGSGLAVVTDASGNPWLALRGPVTGAASENGFNFVKISSDGRQVLSSERLGGASSATDGSGWALHLDYQNRIWLSGTLVPESFTITSGAAQTAPCSAESGAFFRRYLANGTLDYSGFTTAPVLDFGLDINNRLFFARAGAVSQALLTTDGAAMQAYCAVNSASFKPAGIAPGEAFTLFGVGMGTPQGGVWAADLQGKVSKSINGTRVLVNDEAVPLLYAQSQQINAIAPFSIDPGEEVEVVVEYNGQRSAPLTLRGVASSPGIFIADTKPMGQGAIINQDGRVNGRGNAAQFGTIIAFWVAGMGDTNPSSRGKDAELTGTTPPFPGFLAPVVVRIGGVEGKVEFSGAAPTLVRGIGQINVRLPESLPAATNLDAVPISLQVGDGAPITLATVAVRQ